MNENKLKDGVSVKQIESFAKKHRFAVFFCLIFILACFFSFVMFGPGWAIIATVIGALIGILLPGKVLYATKSIHHFIFKQEQTTQLVLGVVGLILAVFLPPLWFLILGLHGGKDIYHLVTEVYAQYHKMD